MVGLIVSHLNMKLIKLAEIKRSILAILSIQWRAK